MKIEGKLIARKIYNQLQNRVGELKKIGITPCLTVILVGDDPASVAYVNQKQKWGSFIGAEIIIKKYPLSVTNETLTKKIKQLNTDADIHAILIQRPVPPQIDIQKLELLVDPKKDIDGFHPDSPFTFPLPLAVVKILEEIYFICHSERTPPSGGVEESHAHEQQNSKRSLRSLWSVGMTKQKISLAGATLSGASEQFIIWLSNQQIVVLGKGPTGGGPILKYFQKIGAHPTLIDSKTPDPDFLIKNADIIISAVGKPNIITPEKLKKNSVLISVGIFRGSDGKLHGDYDQQKVENIASYYTPTPGGVGPVNVAMLMSNLVSAAEKQNT